MKSTLRRRLWLRAGLMTPSRIRMRTTRSWIGRPVQCRRPAWLVCPVEQGRMGFALLRRHR